jgi:hypothetical protein
MFIYYIYYFIHYERILYIQKKKFQQKHLYTKILKNIIVCIHTNIEFIIKLSNFLNIYLIKN